MNTTSTERYLMFLMERARHLRKEPYFWSFRAWRVLRGFDRRPYP